MLNAEFRRKVIGPLPKDRKRSPGNQREKQCFDVEGMLGETKTSSSRSGLAGNCLRKNSIKIIRAPPGSKNSKSPQDDSLLEGDCFKKTQGERGEDYAVDAAAHLKENEGVLLIEV